MQIPRQQKEINLDQVIYIFDTDSEGRVAFADYNIPLRTKLLPEHIKGTSVFFEEDNRLQTNWILVVGIPIASAILALETAT
jgi:hypothetical protein